ncbi:MAG: beta galactosidase jelly roll domain-containing protein [Bacteroidota bacterium]
MKLIIALFITTTMVFAAEVSSEKQIVDLRGTWKFEIGDNRKFAEPEFDDKKWTDIFVPSDWENEGFAGYDGYAWYRKSFILPTELKVHDIVLNLGYVDDVCRVYLNGYPIGEGGNFPPEYQTAYNQEQKFRIPKQYLRYGPPNVIAVRVFDEHLNGGIVKGKIGIYSLEENLPFVVTFPEQWKFKTGDDDQWKNSSFDDSKWQDLIVPAKWDFQGYRDYDGYAWYRVSFDVSASLQTDDLVMMLGRIDVIDEAYLNGEKIGATGRMRKDGSVARIREEYRTIRTYDIPNGLLKPGKKNTLAVRVYDNMLIGGIYEGPIGILTEKEYRKWDKQFGWKNWNNQSNFNRLLEKLFNE